MRKQQCIFPIDFCVTNGIFFCSQLRWWTNTQGTTEVQRVQVLALTKTLLLQNHFLCDFAAKKTRNCELAHVCFLPFLAHL